MEKRYKWELIILQMQLMFQYYLNWLNFMYMYIYKELGICIMLVTYLCCSAKFILLKSDNLMPDFVFVISNIMTYTVSIIFLFYLHSTLKHW